MQSSRGPRFAVLALAVVALAVLAMLGTARCRAQAALLLEEPYGFYGLVNPTGHNAMYMERICAETPTHLRRCRPGEQGTVISRYDGIDGYDWIAMPLIAYLYSVEDAAHVPDSVNHAQVTQLRERYREAHFEGTGLDKSRGNIVHGGWTQLVGMAYERRLYAFRFDTTEAQDDALIAQLNAEANRSHFRMLTRNCADFARTVLNIYFPHKFRRSIFPDAGITTPKQVTFKLVRYSRKHPEIELKVFEIPQVPGYRASSRSTKDIAESFSTTIYALPVALMNPYLFGGIFLDYFIRGRFHMIPKNPTVVGPDDLKPLTASGPADKNSASAIVQAHSAAPGDSSMPQPAAGANSGLQESKATNEQDPIAKP
jgi:hypothetical protein